MTRALAAKLRMISSFQLVFINFTISTNSQITPHANARVGDFAVLAQRATATDATIPTAVVPTGFTEVSGEGEVVSTVANRSSVAYRTLASTAAITGMDGTAEDTKVLAIFRPLRGAVGTVTASTWALESTHASDQANQTVSCAGQAAPIIAFGMASKRAGTAVSITGTPSLDYGQYVSPGTLQLFFGFKLFNGSPADVLMDYQNQNNSDMMTTGYLRVAKA